MGATINFFDNRYYLHARPKGRGYGCSQPSFFRLKPVYRLMRAFFNAEAAGVAFLIHKQVIFRMARNIHAHAVFDAFRAGDISAPLDGSLRTYGGTAAAMGAWRYIDNGNFNWLNIHVSNIKNKF